MVKMGHTWVLTTATIDEKVPRWMDRKGKGWLTAEYAMLPRATQQRTIRDGIKGRPSGRSLEIQRLIGRSLRACLDFSKLGERTITIDCDVIQADGGTRTAAINGGFIALKQAVQTLLKKKKIKEDPIIDTVSAVSLGLDQGKILTDLDYKEDVRCDVDMNIVMLGKDQFIEIQGTAEGATFNLAQNQDILLQAMSAIDHIRDKQLETL